MRVKTQIKLMKNTILKTLVIILFVQIICNDHIYALGVPSCASAKSTLLPEMVFEVQRRVIDKILKKMREYLDSYNYEDRCDNASALKAVDDSVDQRERLREEIRDSLNVLPELHERDAGLLCIKILYCLFDDLKKTDFANDPDIDSLKQVFLDKLSFEKQDTFKKKDILKFKENFAYGIGLGDSDIKDILMDVSEGASLEARMELLSFFINYFLELDYADEKCLKIEEFIIEFIQLRFHEFSDKKGKKRKKEIELIDSINALLAKYIEEGRSDSALFELFIKLIKDYDAKREKHTLSNLVTNYNNLTLDQWKKLK